MALTSVSKSKGKKAQPSAEDRSAFGQIAERFRRAGDLERAVSLCREGLQKSPDHISARVTLGWALLELGKFDEAREELEYVLRKRPDNLAAIRALAELHDRAEQTLNLPMDGPGQWPPSPDQVDEMAGGMVADHFRAVSAEESLDPAAADEAYRQNTPAVVPPAELGLAMWSALPETEPAEAEHLSIAPAAAAAEPQPVVDAGVSDADLAALLAEAESLEALVDVSETPAAAFQVEEVIAPAPPASPTATGRATALADVAFDVINQDEPALVLDAQPDLEELTAFATAAAPAPQGVEELTAYAPPVAQTEYSSAVPFEIERGGRVEIVQPAAAVAPPEMAAQMQPEELTAGPAEADPIEPPAGHAFVLESQSAQELEALAALDPTHLEDMAPQPAVDADAQPILRFDLEPPVEVSAVAEAVEVPEVVEVAAAAAPLEAVDPGESVEPVAAMIAVAAEAEPVAPPALVPAEAGVESAVIASAKARIAEVVAMARAESEPVGPKPGLAALERFLQRVQTRQRMMAESVA